PFVPSSRWNQELKPQDFIITVFRLRRPLPALLAVDNAPQHQSNLAWGLTRASAGLPDRDSFELLVGGLKFRVILMDHFWRSALERLLRGNPGKPALARKLFVGREIESYQQSHLPIGSPLRFGGPGLVILLVPFRGAFSGVLAYGLSFRFADRVGFFGSHRF